MIISETVCGNCMDFMQHFSDKYFDLAVVDPPYGINAAKVGVGSRQKIKQKKGLIKGGNWDADSPGENYFNELIRVSKNQIICGGNYFNLPPTRGIICWDKGKTLRGRDFSEWEFIWTSFNTVARLFYYDISADKKEGHPDSRKNKIHPTQKPIALYKWILEMYAKPGDKILDTHLGSGSSRIAAYRLGFDFVGFEIDKEYFSAQENRFQKAISEPLFASNLFISQQTLFL